MTDWSALARRSIRARRLRLGALSVFLAAVSIPIAVPYIWMVMIAFTSRRGMAETGTLWPALIVIVAGLFSYGASLLWLRRERLAIVAGIGVALVLGIVLLGGDLHVQNFRFMVNANTIEELQGQATAGGQFPWVWEAFANSLILAATQTVIVVTVSTLAAYYLSRFSFRGRSAFLQSLLVLQAFPAITLVIPIFLIVFWVGLLNTLYAPILVLTALELPFFIFIMKGFFDAVPWDIEMSAMTDGASRRQAFWMVVLPQVRVGMIAIGVFAFIKGWEEYVFVNGLRTGNSYWVMSTYLYYVREDVMGVDYGMVAAVAVLYVLPALVLYLFCQKYLTQMTLGGVKG
jgi:inositol-phosphate transport system permease protein